MATSTTPLFALFHLAKQRMENKNNFKSKGTCHAEVCGYIDSFSSVHFNQPRGETLRQFELR